MCRWSSMRTFQPSQSSRRYSLPALADSPLIPLSPLNFLPNVSSFAIGWLTTRSNLEDTTLLCS